MVNLKATYENIPNGVASGSTTSGTNAQSFVNWNDFKSQNPARKYATLEINRWLLDGSFSSFPNEPSNIGYMSTTVSDSNGDFQTPITITRTYNDVYISPGIMLEFDTTTDDYPKNIRVDWYVNNVLTSTKTFNIDNSRFFCDNDVRFNKIVITILNTNKPYRFARVLNILDGIEREFSNDEISGMDIIEQINPHNEVLSINQLDMKLIPASMLGVVFQRTIPFMIYRNNELYGRFYPVESQIDKDKKLYKIAAQDYINLLQNTIHLGGIYSNKLASELISEIMGDVPYEIDNSLIGKTVSGYLPMQSGRESLRTILMAIGAIIDTSRNDEVVIKPLSQVVASTIAESRIIDVQEKNEKIVTNYTLIYSKYVEPGFFEREKEELYNGNITENTTVYFDKPMYRITLYDGESSILVRNANYMIVGPGEDNVIYGIPYAVRKQIFSKRNIFAANSDQENTIEIETSLICDGENILDNYSFIKSRIIATFKLENEMVGDLVAINGKKCRILSLNYDLCQNNIYAKAELEEYYE